MNLFNQRVFKAVLVAGVATLLFSCANTKLSQTWVEPSHTKTYKDLLIIGIAESEQNRRAYESHFVEELKTSEIEAETSYRLIKSNEKIDRNSVAKAIKGLGIDAVLVTHLVAVDEETIYRPGMGYTAVGYGAYGGYSGYGRGLYGYYPHVNTYVHSPGYYTTHETYTLETNLYDVKSEELVWSARSRTFSPESVDEVIVDLTRLLIKDLKDKNLIKVK
ncbi:MAG: hypothetical protein GQ550_02070 [Gammaproteobacteria bacterium]|nr:hypothetical protein [Gammaproteobacteria bacterium]